MRFASLGSGSRGNGLLVEAGATRILVDCGFPLRDAVARLARLGLAPGDVAAIVVTHEHGDHIGGVFRLASRYGIPVWMTHGTLNASAGRAEALRIEVFDSHAPFPGSTTCRYCLSPYPTTPESRSSSFSATAACAWAC
jgi:phosphoribosyl 1,2-cyclic phosphodiesterase